VAAHVGPVLSIAVELGQGGCQGIDGAGLERLAQGDPIQQRFLVEARHLEQPLDRLALASDRERATSALGDGHHLVIEHRRGAAVEAQLGVERLLAPGQGGEIEKAVAYRALPLEGAIAHQEDQRGMGGDLLDVRAGRAIGPARAQERAEPVRGSHVSERAGSAGRTGPASCG
jgi:hypothetical protein